MKFLAFMILGIIIFLVYMLVEIVVRFVRRYLLIRRYKKKINSIMQQEANGERTDLS